MHYFVVKFNRRTSEREVFQFEHPAPALARLKELELSRDGHIEVVLLMSQDEHSLRATHGRYFLTPSEIVANAADALGRPLLA